MRPGYQWQIGLRKFAADALLLVAPLVTGYLEELQTHATPRIAAVVGGLLLLWRAYRNATKKATA